jgi:queuine/archaeosine tRNA-ribosyltransferase
MIEDTIKQLEARIESSDACITEDRRRELRKLLETLRAEVAGLAETHEQQAQSIAGFANVSAHEATRSEQNPQLLKLSLEGLNSSVAGFEKSHPRLVQIVNAVSNTLSNLGI